MSVSMALRCAPLALLVALQRGAAVEERPQAYPADGGAAAGSHSQPPTDLDERCKPAAPVISGFGLLQYPQLLRERTHMEPAENLSGPLQSPRLVRQNTSETPGLKLSGLLQLSPRPLLLKPHGASAARRAGREPLQGPVALPRPHLLMQLTERPELLRPREGPLGARAAGSEAPALALLGAEQRCGVSVKVTEHSKSMSCLPQCPFYAPGHQSCSFVCVTKSGCSKRNASVPVADTDLGICRSCRIPGCELCADEAIDKCQKCNKGFILKENGTCSLHYYSVWVIYAVVGVLAIFLIVWIVNLFCRRAMNETRVQQGVEFREKCKLQKVSVLQNERGLLGRHETTVRHDPWPLTTNLLKEQVAGEGMVLFFNFQFAVIVWGALVTLAWLLLALITSYDLLELGLLSIPTPRDYCIIVQWGFKSQHDLAVAKDIFVFVVYVISFFGVLLHEVRQRRHFVAMDACKTTMKDFAARCTGLPPLPGSEKWEDRLKDHLERATGQKVVGVSICWDYGSREEEVMAEVQRTELLLRHRSAGLPHMDDSVERLSCISAPFHNMESSLLKAIAGVGGSDDVEVRPLLHGLQSTNQAFVVFETESSRDAAVEALASGVGGCEFEASKLHLDAVPYEPGSVQFQNVAHGTSAKVYRLILGIGVIFFALAVWTCAFYLPYSHFMLEYTSQWGEEPGFVQSFSFSLVVIIGNQIMYFVCREVASRVGFSVMGTLEACYIVLYTVAIIFNVVVDLLVTYQAAHARMVRAGVPTHDGRPLGEVHSTMEIFQTFAMQKDLGYQLFSYAFPATFLVPFLIEPIMLYWLPLNAMKVLVRRHSELSKMEAESLFGSTSMDLGRYADILVNVTIAVLVFFFAGGYTVLMFGTLVVSHMVIYAYDHWRLLRAVPSFCISTNTVDRFASALLAGPCSLLLGCAVFKTNCRGPFPCTNDFTVLQFRCIAASLAHIFLHVFLLRMLTPCCVSKKDEVATQTFEECSMSCAASWFTKNPVHCLRSQYIYNHNPPCGFHVVGKEHLLKKNKAIGQHFKEQDDGLEAAAGKAAG